MRSCLRILTCFTLSYVVTARPTDYLQKLQAEHFAKNIDRDYGAIMSSLDEEERRSLSGANKLRLDMEGAGPTVNPKDQEQDSSPEIVSLVGKKKSGTNSALLSSESTFKSTRCTTEGAFTVNPEDITPTDTDTEETTPASDNNSGTGNENNGTSEDTGGSANENSGSGEHSNNNSQDSPPTDNTVESDTNPPDTDTDYDVRELTKKYYGPDANLFIPDHYIDDH